NAPAEEGVDLSKYYILTPPFDPIDITLLLALTSQDKISFGELDTEVKEYRRSIFDKLRFIKQQIEIFDKEKTKEHLENIKKPIHKLAGSGGLYGFDKVSSFCKQTETALNEKIESFDKGCDETKDTFLKTLEEIKKCFLEAPAPQEQPKAEIPTQGSEEKKTSIECELFFVDDDEDLLKVIEKIAKTKNINVQTCSSFAKAQELFKDPNFKPKFLLVDLHSDKEQISGYDLIKSFRESNPLASSTFIGILSAKKELTDKVKATELGIDLYFEKPVAPDVLIYQIQKLNETKIEEKQQILLIDDDIDFCKIIASNLKNTSLNLTMYHDGNDFFKRIDEGNYSILLLDLNLPGLSGLDLLGTLRSDYRYRKLPVVIITATNDLEIIKKAYNLGIQDYIVKPITPEDFKNQVETILKKKQSLDVIYQKEDRFNFYTKQSLQDFFLTYSINYSYISVVTFTLSTKDQSIQHVFAKKLEDFFGNQDIKGFWQEGVFVLLLIQLMPTQLRIILETFYDQVKREDSFEDKTKFANAVISVFPNDGDNIDALVSKSLTILEATKDTYFGISLTQETKETRFQSTKKFIYLISNNKILARALEYSLNLRGYTVKLSNEGKESYDYISSIFLKNPPDIIILDSELKDEDPIILLEKLKRLIGERIPIIYLSQRTREEDIIEGLSKGASSYVTKPFSISMLLHRIEQRSL
ncbi:hypothetical protein COB11_05270, partial [Candidatus Aerophobetes bacterium]